jgi:cell division protein FtsB
MKRGARKERRKLPLLFIISAAVFVSFMLSFFMGQSGILRLQQMRRDYESMVFENHRLALENRQLVKEIENLRRDPATLEKIAREDLHFVSPHDVVLLVPSENQ